MKKKLRFGSGTLPALNKTDFLRGKQSKPWILWKINRKEVFEFDFKNVFRLHTFLRVNEAEFMKRPRFDTFSRYFWAIITFITNWDLFMCTLLLSVKCKWRNVFTLWHGLSKCEKKRSRPLGPSGAFTCPNWNEWEEATKLSKGACTYASRRTGRNAFGNHQVTTWCNIIYPIIGIGLTVFFHHIFFNKMHILELLERLELTSNSQA